MIRWVEIQESVAGIMILDHNEALIEQKTTMITMFDGCGDSKTMLFGNLDKGSYLRSNDPKV